MIPRISKYIEGESSDVCQCINPPGFALYYGSRPYGIRVRMYKSAGIINFQIKISPESSLCQDEKELGFVIDNDKKWIPNWKNDVGSFLQTLRCMGNLMVSKAFGIFVEKAAKEPAYEGLYPKDIQEIPGLESVDKKFSVTVFREDREAWKNFFAGARHAMQTGQPVDLTIPGAGTVTAQFIDVNQLK